MEILSVDFFSALLAIIVIDLVLAGDNAIVIALAARNVPAHLQKRAIIWGAAGAIIVRSSLTMVVVWLLAIPGLLFAGGALLVWIAYKLLLPEPEDDARAKMNCAKSFWGALRTIVCADIIMGLDNILAVAGASHGSYLLVILGLLISVPIVVWGSTVILRYIGRFPALVYVGAGVLAWTAARMMAAEPLFAHFYAEHRPIVPFMYALIIVGVLWAGFVKNHRRTQSRINARLASIANRSTELNPRPTTGGNTMLKVLVPVDASPNAMYAARHVIDDFMKNGAMEVHLLNVQPPFSRHIARFTSRKNRRDFHRDQAEKALGPVKEFLNSSRIPHAVHIELGEKAKVIASTARRLHCDKIVMATARKNSLTRMIEDSTTNQVLELTDVPVEVIAGDAVSRLERYGIPAGIGTLLALALIAAAD